jgi:hypothetical protein
MRALRMDSGGAVPIDAERSGEQAALARSSTGSGLI